MVDRIKALDELTVTDLGALRLILRGDSVIDWHRLELETEAEVRELLRVQEIHPEEAADRTRMEQVKREAIRYLREYLEYPIPKPVGEASIEQLFLIASGKGHRQTCACAILKAMSIVHHLEGRELLYVLPLSDAEVFQLVEEKVYRVIGSMLAGGFPIIEFVGGRKNRDSLYTKLLSKQDTIAAQVFDKLRFRIVTRSYDDIFPVVQYLTTHLFPFNYVVPGQSINSLFPFRRYCEGRPHLRAMLPQLQGRADDEITPTDNRFTAESYRVIHFVVDMPVRVPRRILERAPAAAQSLGHVIFVICEFQVVDRETEARNEQGEASHSRYKERQRKAVMRRLQVGTKQTDATPVPPPSAPMRRRKSSIPGT